MLLCSFAGHDKQLLEKDLAPNSLRRRRRLYARLRPAKAASNPGFGGIPYRIPAH